jgi:hypothetical protein
MEWLPKLYDTLDSIFFSLCTRYAGMAGQRLRILILLVAVVVLAGCLAPIGD